MTFMVQSARYANFSRIGQSILLKKSLNVEKYRKVYQYNLEKFKKEKGRVFIGRRRKMYKGVKTRLSVLHRINRNANRQQSGFFSRFRLKKALFLLIWEKLFVCPFAHSTQKQLLKGKSNFYVTSKVTFMNSVDIDRI